MHWIKNSIHVLPLYHPGEANTIYNVLQTVCERLISAEELLNGLDSESGDGDCGSTMARGAHGRYKAV